MRTACSMLVGLNVLAAAVALYVSMEWLGSATSVSDVLQVLAGISFLTAVSLSYFLIRKTSQPREV